MRLDPSRLQKLRAERGWTQEDLATKAHLGRRTIQRLEKQGGSPTADTLASLAKALEVAPSALLVGGSAATARLDDLIAVEVERGERHGVPWLGPRRYQDLQTAYLAYSGRQFWCAGVVGRNRGVPQPEAERIGSRNGIAARVLVSCDVAVGAPPLVVHVYSARAEHTVELQDARGYVRELVVEAVAADEPVFAFLDQERLKPWALVVRHIHWVERS